MTHALVCLFCLIAIVLIATLGLLLDNYFYNKRFKKLNEQYKKKEGPDTEVDSSVKTLTNQIERDMYGSPHRMMGLSEFVGRQIPARQDVLDALNSTDSHDDHHYEYSEDGEIFECPECDESIDIKKSDYEGFVAKTKPKKVKKKKSKKKSKKNEYVIVAKSSKPSFSKKSIDKMMGTKPKKKKKK